MNVLQRKMFAEGDLVNNSGRTPFDPPEFQKYELSASIESTPEGAFVYVERNPRGEVVKQELINTNLSPTGDPAEAYKVQARNQGLDFAQKSLMSAAGLYGGKSLLTGIGKKAVEKFGPAITGALGSKFSPVSLTKKGGIAVPGTKGVQARDPSKLSSYRVDVKPGSATGIGVVAATTALGAGKTSELDIAEELQELEEKKKINTPQTQKQIDVNTATNDAEYEVVTTGEQDEEKQLQDEVVEVETTPEQKQAGIFASKNFSDLIRNIGIKMVETGEIGEGIAQGSALTAEEQKAAEKAGVELSEFDEFLAKERIKNTAPDKIAKQTADLAEAVSDYEQGQITLQMFQKVKDIMTTGEITGLGPISSTLFNKAMSFLPGGANRPLTARQRAKVVLEQIANGNIKTITGESGRTISNVDRQIAEKLVGSLNNFGTSETEVLARIDSQINTVTQRTSKALNKYKATALYFTQNDLAIPLTPQDFSQSSDVESEQPRKRLKMIK